MVDKCLGHQRIAAAQLASAVAPTIPSGTREVWLQSYTNNVRFTLDGTTPTATVGMLVFATSNTPVKITLGMGLMNLKFIAESGSPNLNLVYFGQSDT